MSPDTAFWLLIVGWFGIYFEFIRPGHVAPGIAGAAAVIAGGYRLWQADPTPLGLALLGTAAGLFILDAFAETFLLAGLAATAALAFGFSFLIPAPPGIAGWLAIAGALVLGAVTMALNWIGRRARRNKWADLQ